MARESSPTIHFLITTILAAVSLGLYSQHRLNWLTTPVNFLASPFRTPFVSLQFWGHTQADLLRNLPHQQRLIKDLKRRNSELALEATKATQLEQENQVLRSALKIQMPQSTTPLPAKIIGLSRFAIINQGSLAGIKPGQPAISEGIFLGEVVEVLPHTSRIRLVADPDTQVPIITSSGTAGTLRYESGVVKITAVLQKDILKAEEPVYIKGSDFIPSGLLVGTIKQIEESATAIHKSAVIESAASITDEQIILILL